MKACVCEHVRSRPPVLILFKLTIRQQNTGSSEDDHRVFSVASTTSAHTGLPVLEVQLSPFRIIS